MGEILFLILILAVAIFFTYGCIIAVDVVGKLLWGFFALLFWVIIAWLISAAFGD